MIAVYFLALSRIASFLYTGIFFSIKGIPNLVKIGFSLVLSYVVFMTMSPAIVVEDTVVGFALQVMAEAVYGMTLGYTTYLIFVTVQMAGQLVDIQIGFSIGSVYDPVTENKVSIFGKFYYWLSLALFLALDVHHFMILAIVKTYDIIPLGSGQLQGFFTLGFMSIFTGSLEAAFQIALPMMMILLLTDIIMGMLARTVPQINVFILGLPLKVLIGITVLIILLPAVAESIVESLEVLPYYLDKVIKSFTLIGGI
jgi:flagellar biosynthetic protein FliR